MRIGSRGSGTANAFPRFSRMTPAASPSNEQALRWHVFVCDLWFLLSGDVLMLALGRATGVLSAGWDPVDHRRAL